MSDFDDEEDFIGDSNSDVDRTKSCREDAWESTAVNNSPSSRRLNYTTLTRTEAIERMDGEIDKVLDALSALAPHLRPIVNETMVDAMLAKRSWRSDAVVEDCCYNADKMAAEAGYDFKKISEQREKGHIENYEPDATFECPITCEDVKCSETASLACGHRASLTAWKGYLFSSIEEGKVQGLKCMFCEEPMAMDLVRSSLVECDIMKEKWLTRRADNLVRACSNFKSCPGADCSGIIYLKCASGNESISQHFRNLGVRAPQDCTCELCQTIFCFSCGLEAHSPIPCEVISAWDAKNQGEGGNMIWIFVHTKNCPKCKQPIEKNQGCMHMTCRCGYEFCWLCMGNWKTHSGDFYRCNVYETRVKSGLDKDIESEKERAQGQLERYAHYFERYRAHMQGQRIAQQKLLRVLKEIEVTRSETALSPEHPPPLPRTSAASTSSPTVVVSVKRKKNLIDHRDDIDARFIERMRAAIEQIVEGRRMLKYSYAFGYYADWARSPQTKDLYEHQQGQLEWALDRLQGLTELFDFSLCSLEESKSWDGYNRELAGLTRVVYEFFTKMKLAFESDIVPLACPSAKVLSQRKTSDDEDEEEFGGGDDDDARGREDFGGEDEDFVVVN